MWKVKRAMVEGAREVCGSVRVGGGNPKSVWWNNQEKAVVKIKEAAWCLEIYKKEKKLKGVYIKARRRSMNSLEGK